MRFEKKGSGAVIFVSEIAVKASSVDRAFSMGKLCKKLGDFEEGTYPDVLEKAAPEPVSSVNLEEWKAYQKEFAGVPKKAGSRGEYRACPHEGAAQVRAKKGALPSGPLRSTCFEYRPALSDGAAESGTAFSAFRPEKGAWRQAAF